MADSYLFILSTSSQARTSQVILHSVQPTFGEILEKIWSIKTEIAAMIRLQKKLEDSSESERTTSSCEGLFVNEKMKIMERLIGMPMHCERIAILGMGGIGKTSLAQNVYEDDLVKYHFYVRGWVTVSQAYQRRKMLLGLLDSISQLSNSDMSDEQINERLYRYLKGKRYLIVLDDLWSENAWDDIRRSFPDDRNGSRIMITSRLSHMAKYACANYPTLTMPFLDKEQSFALLCKEVFAVETCPLELENIGKQIAENCKGLPLAIVVVAGLLSNDKTRTWWEDIARQLDVASKYKQVLSILAMSYYHLPHHLRQCFLYFGVYPEDVEIPASELIPLWIAEGFVLPVEGKSLEEVAENQLEDLASRNVIVVRKRNYNGRVKTCTIHDFFRELCLKVAEEQKFFILIKNHDQNHPTHPFSHRRVVIHSAIGRYMHSEPSFADTDSFLCFDSVDCIHFPDEQRLKKCFFALVKFKHITILDIRSVNFFHFPKELLTLRSLRYLSVSLRNVVKKGISNLHGLQTFVINYHGTNVKLPWTIWKLRQLRHLHLKRGGILPHPKNRNLEALENLQTLFTVSEGCTREVLALTPNLKKLRISSSVLHLNCLSFHYLRHMDLLESLKWVNGVGPIYNSNRLCLPRWEDFPPGLRKLSLCGSHLPWKEMSIIGKLPNLEVLKLRNEAFQGPEWEPNDGEFCHLKLLVLSEMNLLHWRACSSHFPSLVRVIFRRCYFLQEIPSEIGEIATLQMIELHDPNPMAAKSAKKIEEEQRNMGNDDLKIYVTGLTNLHLLLGSLK